MMINRRLSDSPGVYGRKINHAIRDNHIHASIADGQMFDLAKAELDIRQSCASLVRRDVSSGLGEHLRCHINTDYPTGRNQP
ncbi:MAG: hypothetical protein KatS3mg104_2881 [Phycisphaerae bacterium]|nr:MAG: hypothetical protein KatS3mg104_2881 [Phycisphaerae bacterium]